MSHVAEVKTVFKNLDDIAAAAVRLGGKLVLGQKTFKWYSAKGRADHAIKFPGASYEVGVTAQLDGTFRLQWDSWSTGGLLPYMGENAGRFSQAYGVEAARRAARVKGYVVHERTRQDGHIELEMVVR